MMGHEKGVLDQTKYKIIVKKGQQFLTYKGEILPDQINSKVEQDAKQSFDGKAMVTVTVLAFLKDTVKKKSEAN